MSQNYANDEPLGPTRMSVVAPNLMVVAEGDKQYLYLEILWG